MDLMRLLPKGPIDSFGVSLLQWVENRRVGEFCNSLTEVPVVEAVHGHCFLVTGTR